MSQPRTSSPWLLGLDIGIASVGWCALGEKRIVDLGVYCFDRAETSDGESLNAVRRMARLARHRLHHRAARLLKVARLMKREGLIDDARMFLDQKPIAISLWELRKQALDHCLSGEEWARVIYHICKHRGFYFPRKSEANASEGGKVKKGLERTKALMCAENYRSVAEMMLTEFPDNQRNKRGDYGQSLARELLGEELTRLFSRQRELGNPFTRAEFESAILDPASGLLWIQRPALTGEAMLKLMGKCTFERAEYRAAKHTWSAERFIWLGKLNNLKLSINGDVRALVEAEREAVINLPYTQKSPVKYKQLKTVWVKQGLVPETTRFVGLRYRNDGKDAEEEKLVEPQGWHRLRKALESAGLKTEWQGLATQHDKLDDIATALTIYKSDDEIRAALRSLDLQQPVVDALLDVSFTDFVRLSIMVLRNILPHMERGLRYDEACEAAGYSHSQPVCNEGMARLLPSLYVGRDKDGRLLFNPDHDIPRNPVVLRALNQARKVVNALIRKYGTPQRVHIEMARDLSRPLDERQKIKKEQDEYRDRNERARSDFESEFQRPPSGREFEKWQLYREQDGKCAYSLAALDLGRVVDDASYAEVDHALPYSRSYDDSKLNKVLVLKRENQQKGNRTPFEYMDGVAESERWRRFEACVNANPKYRQAKRDRLLRKQFGADEAAGFKERNLNDTRYICRFFKNFVEQNLQLAGEGSRCVVLSGRLTAFLRTRWGLLKVRDESDRHHALDAAVVAACDHGLVKRLSDYARRRELDAVREGFVDAETGEVVDLAALRKLDRDFPQPWPHFHEELEARLKIDDKGKLREAMVRLGTYNEAALDALRPLFVVRAVQRRNSGAAHKETIYAQPEHMKAQSAVTEKVALSSLKFPDLEKLIEPHRNEKLYAAIRKRLEEFGGKGDKAFPVGVPFHKPGKDGNPNGPIVRAVTLVIDKLTGIPVRGGVAKNDSMLRVDVFTKGGKFFLVPVYVHHRVAKMLPNRAIVQGKDESEWTLIDDSFGFCFSLYPNVLVRVTLRKETHLGYYAGCDRSTGAISLWAHDRNLQVGKDGLIRGIGVKTALSIEKFNVDVLGHIYCSQPELRGDLA